MAGIFGLKVIRRRWRRLHAAPVKGRDVGTLLPFRSTCEIISRNSEQRSRRCHKYREFGDSYIFGTAKTLSTGTLYCGIGRKTG